MVTIYITILQHQNQEIDKVQMPVYSSVPFSHSYNLHNYILQDLNQEIDNAQCVSIVLRHFLTGVTATAIKT